MTDAPNPVTRRSLLAALPVLLAAPAFARGAAPIETLSGAAFGTRWRVTLPPGHATDRLATRIARILAGIDAGMSPWRADSGIGRFNAGNAAEAEVPDDTAAVTTAALALAADSGGTFDPTVGPLVGRWGFGPITGETRPQGWRGIHADDRTIRRDDPALTLDLCGIAKGYALDRVAALLRDAGETDALIDLGGELAALGRHPSGRDWQIAVENPRDGAAGAAEVLRPGNFAVATSGDRVNGYDFGGRRVSHIIDPAAAAPVESPLGSVTVLAATGAMADGWATALFAAGARGPALAESRGLAALFLYRDGGRATTGGFAAHLA